MKVLAFTFSFLLITLYCAAQSGSIRLGSEITNGIMTDGCSATCRGLPTDPDFICSDQSDNSGNHSPETMTHNIVVPSGSYLEVTVTTNECDANTDGLDSGDFFLVNGVTVVTGSGNTRVNYQGCFFNNDVSDLTIPLSLIANRRDETVTVTWTISPTNPGGLCDSPSTLPVQFSDFQVVADNKATKITFSTAIEINNDYFSIERSDDGTNYETVGTIKGAGNSNVDQDYSFVDKNPLPGQSYYRVKQTDFDGAFNYSIVRSVRHFFHGFNIYPLTTPDRLSIRTDIENYSIYIFSTSGQEVKRFASLSLDNDISLSDLSSGVYLMQVGNAQYQETIRVIKL